MNSKDLLFTLTGACASSGTEQGLAEKAAKLFEPYCHTRVDQNGNLIATLKEPHPTQKGDALPHHLMLDAHLDEIGLVVTGITEEGFVKAAAVGGLDQRLLLASEVVLHGKEEVYGIFSATPPHLQSEEERKKPLPLNRCYIDTGYTKEELEGKISLGDHGTFIGPAAQLLNGRIVSKSLDNRASCAVLVKTAQLLAQAPPSCQVSFVLSVKEEVNAAGAKTAAFALKPTHAIAVDVSFAVAPGVPEKEARGELGDGALISFSPVLDRQMSNALIELAKEKQIPYFVEAGGGRTYTNADAIAPSGEGVITSVVSVPLRYMHTPVEVCQEDDIDHIASLLFHYAHTL